MTAPVLIAESTLGDPPTRLLTAARFAIEPGRRGLPDVTETLPLAEQLRRALLARCFALVKSSHPGLAHPSSLVPHPFSAPALSGKDGQGRPRCGHAHAFFLPTDEDGDGKLDHLTVFAPMGFNALESRAIDTLAHLRFTGGDPLSLRLLGAGHEHHLRSGLLAESTDWRSATPFVATRYPKLRGRKRDRPQDYTSPGHFARHILEDELQRRGLLSGVRRIDDEEVIGGQRLHSLRFQRSRRKPGDDGGRRPSGAFRIQFAAKVGGPLCLGHACHFGLGLFLPSPFAAREVR
jgi:CRISPR-associated protein Csb2